MCAKISLFCFLHFRKKMGNKQSHDELDDAVEEKGTLRDFIKSKSPTLSSSGSKRISKEDETDGVRRMSNNSSQSSDKDVSITEAASPDSGTPSGKPDGITKLAKVSNK